MLEARRLYLVPSCDAETDGELSVLGVRQACALGDALGDIALRAVYTGAGTAAEETAEAVAQRHGLVIRRKPTLDIRSGEPLDEAAPRIVSTFEALARVGPGRTSLVVASGSVAEVIVHYCLGEDPASSQSASIHAGSLTEITVGDQGGYIVERFADTVHLGHLRHHDELRTQSK